MKRTWRILGVAVVALSSACGPAFIGAAVANAANKDSGNAPTLVGGLSVDGADGGEPKTSPARIRFTLSNAKSVPAAVDLYYTLPSDPQREIFLTALDDVPALFTTSPDGTVHRLLWRFADEPGIQRQDLVEGVTVLVRVRTPTAPQQQVTVRLGNDAAVVRDPRVPDREASGVVAVRFVVADSSNDVVDVRVEYAEAAGSVWQLARPAGLEASIPTPDFALAGVSASSGGTELLFLWDTARDVVDVDRDVRLRLTARDPIVEGTPVETDVFRVDNNDEPTVQLLTSNGADQGRGIQIPFTVADEESDTVRVLFQWRRQGETDFQALGTDDPQELARLVRDPRFLREKQVCRPFAAFTGGQAWPVGDRRIRLPDLLAGSSQLLGRGGLEFRVIELLRPQLSPGVVASGLVGAWQQNGRTSPLSSPVAALPLAAGCTALVLDAFGHSWRLVELELATGRVVRTVIEQVAGNPTAMQLDLDGHTALVATAGGGSWVLHGVDLDDGSVGTLVTAAGESPKALLAISDSSALATSGTSLFRLSWSGQEAPVTVLRSGLPTPWGLTHDPTQHGHVLVALRDADRIVSFDLATRAITPLPPNGASPPVAFPRPTSIASDGGRLVASCASAVAGERLLLAFDVNAGRNTAYEIGRVPAMVNEASTVARGTAGLVLVSLPATRDLVAGGGIEQQRELVSFDTASATATASVEFDPVVRPAQPWRMATNTLLFERLRGRPSGAPAMFVWDSRDAGSSELVFFRALAFDTQLGGSAVSSFSRDVQNVTQPVVVECPGSPAAVAGGDLDGDGDPDLVCALARQDRLRLFRHEPGRDFVLESELPAGGSGPNSLVVGDLDGDGDLDLACASSPSRVRVFFQDSPWRFTSPLDLSVGAEPRSLLAADLDGDGDLDLACVNAAGQDLTVLWQISPRNYAAETVSGVGPMPRDLAVGDLDGDGDLDLACASFAAASITLLPQDPSHRFSSPRLIPCGDGPTSVVAADLDGDGDLDLACANSPPTPFSRGNVTLLTQDSPGSFVRLPTLAAGIEPTELIAGDLDSDGDADLVCGNGLSSDLTLLLQRARGGFSVQRPLQVPSRGLLLTAVMVSDLDGDARADLVCATSAESLVLFFAKDADLFGPPTFLLSTGASPFSLAAGDVDRDGDLDLVAGNYGDPSSLAFFYQDEPRRFLEQPALSNPGGLISAVAVADLDGNGFLDVICANSHRDSPFLTVFKQDALRSFRQAHSLQTGRPTKSVAVGDIDGDGAFDLVSGNPGGTLTVFLQGRERGIFPTPPTEIQVPGTGPTWVITSDLDRDDRLEVVSANLLTRDVRVFSYQAPNSFPLQHVLPGLPVGYQPTTVTAADVDGDGAADLVATAWAPGPGRGSLTIFFQDRTGQFPRSQAQTLVAGDNPQAATAADLDGDGDIDLACVNYGSGTVSVFLQIAPRVFVASRSLSTGRAPYGLVAADLDGDGDTDLAAAGQADIAVYYHR